MTLNLHPHEAYKDSGTQWLGQIPSHWAVSRLKRFVQNVVDLTSEKADDGRFISLQDIESWTGRVRDTDTQKGFTGQAKRFDSFDVLFGKLRPYLAKVTRLPKPGVCVGELLVLRPHRNDVDSGFLELLLRSAPFINYVNAATQGAKMPRAEWDVVGGTSIALPPVDEQIVIDRYIRAVNARVDRLIRNKRRLIALLTEQKQAIIQQAVTRGLDPDVPLKPSGVAWLGEIPAHWSVRRWKSLLSEPLQYGAIESGDDYSPDLPRYIRITDITEDNQLRDNTAKSLPWSTAQPYLLEAGDLLLARSGATSGKTFLYEPHFGPAAFAGYLIRARFGAEVTPRYMRLFTQSASYWSSIRLSAIQATIENVSAEKYAQIAMPLPPIYEQASILERLAHVLGPIEDTKARAVREIDLIREYRTRLIADVVTGQIDVRELAASLPEDDSDLALEFLESTDWEGEPGEIDDSDVLEGEMVGA